MIRESFIFLDRIKEKTELNLWQQGIRNWTDFYNTPNIRGFSPARKLFYESRIRKASKELLDYNSGFFKDMDETWRLYDYFKDDAVFLDIEASTHNGIINVIGLYDGYDTKIMVRNFNLDKDLLKKTLADYKLIITFNGGSFDLPTIQRYFKDVLPNVPHIDLRYVCARVGLTGGLKQIEQVLSIKRPSIIEDMYGGDPALLWRKYLATGNKRFIELLVEYNEEDIINLQIIANKVIKELWEQTYSTISPPSIEAS